jgi:hypothetical protein|tara:strand:+ start:186 stop:503 length:318 start_codon:yes stop_codon:yes gene_type:complete
MVLMLHQLLDLRLNLFMGLQTVYTLVVVEVEHNLDLLNTEVDLVDLVVVELEQIVVVHRQLLLLEMQLSLQVLVVEVEKLLLLEEMVLMVLCLLNYQAQQLLLHQ